MVSFSDFFALFIPSMVNFLIPAIVMSFAVPSVSPRISSQKVEMKFGAKRVITLVLLAIATAVIFHNFLGLPPALGMMAGLPYFKF